MNFDEFVSKYIDKETDYDGVYGAQCVDLIKVYLHNVFNIKAGSWGDARCYYEQFNFHNTLKKNFTRIANSASFIPQKGDICVWNKYVSKHNDCGHVAIATGEGDLHTFYTYDQNWNGKKMKKVKHNYNYFYGVLRPKDQSKISSTNIEFKNWKNGSTAETVYADTSKKLKIGTIDPYERAECLGMVNGKYIVIYNITNTNIKKIGFVDYHG